MNPTLHIDATDAIMADKQAWLERLGESHRSRSENVEDDEARKVLTRSALSAKMDADRIMLDRIERRERLGQAVNDLSTAGWTDIHIAEVLNLHPSVVREIREKKQAAESA